MATTVLRSCSLCEAGCGLAFTVEGDRILAVAPDETDPHSAGYVCPKGVAIADVHHDPDRLRQPMRRTAGGHFEPIPWNEAFALAGERLRAVRAQHGNDAVGLYFGNPLVHSYSGIMALGALSDALATRNRTSASTQDTAPRFAASHYLYGNTLLLPVPDLDCTDFLLCVGANPAVSNGSVMVTPNVRARLRALRERGGTLVTIDPRRSETARLADEHVFIRPGTDAAFLLAMLNALLDSGAIASDVIARTTVGWEHLAAAVQPFTPERTAAMTGIDAAVTRRLAAAFAAARRGVVYTRIGVCNNAWGTLATWAGDLLNIATGRLGAEGGAMFAEPALDGAAFATMAHLNGHGRWHSRVRRLPEIGGDLPAAVLAEEIETPGEGQIRAMVTIAGNPVLSTPNGRRLAAALERLDFMVSVDLYINETTRHADLILPPAWAMTEEHSEPLAPSVSIRSHVRVDPPVVPRPAGELAEWDILLRLARELGGSLIGPGRPARLLNAVERATGWRLTPRHLLALLFRMGPHGNRFLPWRRGITLAQVAATPHGIDLGRARTGLHRLAHRDARVHVADGPFLDACAALAQTLDRTPADGELLLIGRRELRSNNSWMHNVASLVSGRERCVLYVHPDDAARAGLRDSQPALLTSRVHSATVPVRVTDEVMPGVVSLPHGWGHAASAPWQRVAGSHPGVSANDFTDDQHVEGIVGQSILNGVPVRLAPAPAAASAA